MTGKSPQASRLWRPAFRLWPWLGVWLLVSAVVWNGVFDILVTRGVKEYLYRQADHELGRGPRVTMHEIMDQTVRDAAVTASLWALLVGGAGAVTVLRLSRPRSPAGH
ncbi:MAG: hypothetical protein HYU53_12090 [Acidobacteria bacterium]|nr:hypothetical protein [Acidobacteriota bacterium]